MTFSYAKSIPPEGHPLRELGKYLADVLDEDQWARAEELLLQAWNRRTPIVPDDAMVERVADAYEEAWQEESAKGDAMANTNWAECRRAGARAAIAVMGERV